MAVYPGSLPHLARLGHMDETLGADVLRTSMDAGPDKVRRLSSAAPDNLSMGHGSFTLAQKNTLGDFFRDTLQHGTLSFEMADPDGGLSSFRFLQGPRFQPVGGGKYSVSVQLERLP